VNSSANQNAEQLEMEHAKAGNLSFGTFYTSHKRSIGLALLVTANLSIFTYFGFATARYVSQGEIKL
jgi:hypothetical protein